MRDYSGLSDEELIERYKKGELEIADYMVEKYKPLVRSRANALFLVGGDGEDLLQEATIGLLKAMRDFDREKAKSFSAFADLCVRRQLYTAIENDSRKKNNPLNSYVPIDSDREEPDITDLLMTSVEEGPEERVIREETIRDMLLTARDRLSPMEKKVFERYISGMRQSDIAEDLGKSAKSIDNCLQRIKQKLRQDLIK